MPAKTFRERVEALREEHGESCAKTHDPTNVECCTCHVSVFNAALDAVLALCESSGDSGTLEPFEKIEELDGGTPDAREDVCDRCHQPNPLSWFVASDIWNRVMRGGERGNIDRYHFCCPTCFIALARECGIDPTAWELVPEDHERSAEKELAELRAVAASSEGARDAGAPDIQDDPGDLYHRPRTKIELDGRVATCAGNHDWREPCVWSYRRMTIDELESHLKAEAIRPSPEPTK